MNNFKSFLSSFFLIYSISLNCQESNIEEAKLLMTVLSADFPKEIDSKDYQDKVNSALRQTLGAACSNLYVRPDYGFNESSIPEDEKLRLDKDIRDILSLTIEERQAIPRESLTSIKERTTAHYLFYPKVYYNPQSDIKRYEMNYSIVLLDDMLDVKSGSISWSYDKTSASDLRIVFTHEFRQLSFCKVTNTSSDSRENLLEELRWIASARISDPNDLSLKETVEEDILPYDKVKRLYHSEYEKELDDRILRLIPLDETPIPSEDKKILRYYINLQLEFYSEAIGHYPELRRGYEKKRVRLINMRGNLEL